MNNYDVKIIRTIETTLSVPSENEQEAIFKVKDLVDTSKISKVFVTGISEQEVKVKSDRKTLVDKIKEKIKK